MQEEKYADMIASGEQIQQSKDSESSLRSLEACINVIYGLDEVIRQCYAEKINYTEDELAEIMLVDGCFALELSSGLMSSSVNLRNRSLALLSSSSAYEPKVIRKEPVGADVKHLLDLLYQFYYLPAPATGACDLTIDRVSLKQTSSWSPSDDPRATIRSWGFGCCALKLLESGIELQVGSSTEDQLLEITFILAVRMALQHTPFLMASLMHSWQDINLLTRKKIYRHNWIGGQEYSTQLGNILDKVVAKNDFYYGTLYNQVNDYRKSYRWSRLQVFLRVQYQRQKGILCATYFSTTWKVVSLFVGLTFLLLTTLQTYYTIHPARR
ncbi:hypothetical protein M0R45_002440 [Rubus argutus]|uniref:Uncharacterized protein n=1 Tax=Rubus argutus TaxID=59490 RepID=A0AAW1VQW0_RUBAR